MKYTTETVADICKALRSGNTHKDAATLVGINEDTFYEWMKKPEFSEAIKKAETDCKSRNIGIIQSAAIRTWQAAAWFLERRYHDEYALKNIEEHQGNDDKPITVKIIEDKKNEE